MYQTYIYNIVMYITVSHNMMHVNVDLYEVERGFAGDLTRGRHEKKGWGFFLGVV